MHIDGKEEKNIKGHEVPFKNDEFEKAKNEAVCRG